MEHRLEPWFVTGLIEATGSFTYSRTSGRNMNMYFSIKLPAADKALLARVRSFFKLAGRIFDVTAASSRGSAYYRVGRLGELLDVLNHFDEYPLVGQKRRSYQVWREMVLLKQRIRSAPLDELNTLASLLTKLSGRGPAASAGPS